MLTKEDLQAITVIFKTTVQNEVRSALQIELKPIKKQISRIEIELKSIKRKLDTAIKFFDREHLKLEKRVDRVEEHLKLPPLIA